MSKDLTARVTEQAEQLESVKESLEAAHANIEALKARLDMLTAAATKTEDVDALEREPEPETPNEGARESRPPARGRHKK